MSTVTSAKQILHLPRRINHVSWAELERNLGIKRVCASEHTQHGNFCQCEMPSAGWKIADSDVSPYQKRLVMPDGTQVAKLFYKESFHSGSLELMVQILYLPRRINHASWAELERTLGIKRVCIDNHTQHGNFCPCVMPSDGWKIADSDVSPYQKRLVMPDGTQVAKLFYKESFHSGSLELMVPVLAQAA